MNRLPREILDEMLTLTNRMTEQRHDADFLVDGMQKRQLLFEELEGMLSADPALKEQVAYSEEMKAIADKILKMDRVIAQALQSFRDEVRASVVETNNKQRVLGYLNNAISSTGSYMDYKK